MRIEEALALMGAAYPWFWPLLIVILGGVVGSFMGCMVYRLPRGLSAHQPPSYCPACQHRLTARELVPIISWLFLKGRCAQCHAPIGIGAIMVEGVAIGEGVFVYMLTGASWKTVIGILALWSLTFCLLFWREKRKIATK